MGQPFASDSQGTVAAITPIEVDIPVWPWESLPLRRFRSFIASRVLASERPKSIRGSGDSMTT